MMSVTPPSLFADAAVCASDGNATVNAMIAHPDFNIAQVIAAASLCC
jgi:hypothetical protein